jgi:hypothetical protein
MNARLVGSCLAAGLSIAAASDAQAFGRGGGSSQMGDSWLNDMQKNPRFIEPYADRDPARYRASHPREGWYDRQRAAYPYGPPPRRSPWGG